MKNCEREQEVAAAVRSSTFSEDLRDHVGICETCGEVILVTGFIHEEIVPATANLNPPDAALIWRRAQEAARRKALAKATAPIRIARICALVVALVALPWVLNSFSIPSSLSDFGLQHLGTLNHALSEDLTPAILGGIGTGMISLLLSSWYVLRQE